MTMEQAKSEGSTPLTKRPTGYFSNIRRAITSTFEGLAVTSSWLFRRPITIQYPDKIPQPIQDSLPDNYRGILEVDLARCSGCMLCAKTCPINVLDIQLEKNPETGVREIMRFDIDIGRCMYCGLCSEACAFDSLRHTTEFEAVASSPDRLVLRYVKTPVPVAKGKGNPIPRRPQGAALAEVAPPTHDGHRWSGRAPEPEPEPEALPAEAGKVAGEAEAKSEEDAS
ncbi:MAG: 4Fe-4S dicluster domain-containing protein [Deltaproteobacteria bacterium]|nr:4Fe-4S dicluster domain-containing protein [Deltaproteobacteria bacterium]